MTLLGCCLFWLCLLALIEYMFGSDLRAPARLFLPSQEATNKHRSFLNRLRQLIATLWEKIQP